MIFKEPGPLSPEMEELLAQERTLVAAPADLRARVFARVRMRPDASLPPVQAQRPWWRFGAIPLAGLGIAIASVAVAAWRESGSAAPVATARPLAASIVERAQAVQKPGWTPFAPPRRADETVSRTPSSGPVNSPAEPMASTTQADSPELTLLQRARLSLNRGAYRTTLGELAAHQRRFPASALAEEREALRIRALLGLGKREEAQKAAERFRKRYPRSVLAPQLAEVGSTE